MNILEVAPESVVVEETDSQKQELEEQSTSTEEKSLQPEVRMLPESVVAAVVVRHPEDLVE